MKPKAIRIYANGDWTYNDTTDIHKHESQRPGTALVVNGICVYAGIGVSKEKIDSAIKQTKWS